VVGVEVAIVSSGGSGAITSADSTGISTTVSGTGSSAKSRINEVKVTTEKSMTNILLKLTSWISLCDTNMAAPYTAHSVVLLKRG
jgi:hypothetical protein